MERIDIVVDEQELAGNEERAERLRRTLAFEPTDRVPVVINTNQWTALAARGRTASDYFRSPADNLREQILNAKWRIESIRDDQPIPTERLSFQPDLGCLRGVEFDMDITWPEDQPPKCAHPLTEPAQIDHLEIPEPHSGLNGRRIEWYGAMVAAAEEMEVAVNGRRLRIEVSLSQPGGPMPSAFALAGANLFLWMVTDPDRVHRLMGIVTESQMRCTRFFDEMMGRDPSHAVGLGGDTAEMIGPEMFREYAVPYYLRIWEAYGGSRGFHNCGQSGHLLDIMRDELGITAHNGFGSCVDPGLLAEKMSGRVVLRGGPDPCLIRSGPAQGILDLSRHYIETLGTRGGYVLSCGGGAAPGTPVENYHILVEASRQAGAIMVK